MLTERLLPHGIVDLESDWKHVNGTINRGNRAVDREIERVLEKGTKQARNLFVRCLDPLLCPTLHARRWEGGGTNFYFPLARNFTWGPGFGQGQASGQL